MAVRRLEVPEVLRRAWGDEAADAFAVGLRLRLGWPAFWRSGRFRGMSIARSSPAWTFWSMTWLPLRPMSRSSGGR